MITKSPPELVRATLGVQSRLIGASLSNHLSAGRPSADDLALRDAMWVHRCVSINASAAATVPFRLFSLRGAPIAGRSGGLSRTTKQWLRSSWLTPRTKGAIRGRLENMQEIDSHAALDLLQDVNEWSNGFEWRESVYADLQLFGRHYTHIALAGGRPSELWRFMPQKMKVIPSPTTWVDRFDYGHGAEMTSYDPEEVLWIRLFDPHDPWGGLGPLEAWMKTADATLGIQAFQDELFKRFGVPDYIIKTKHEMKPDQKRSFRQEWRRLFGRLWNRKESVAFLSGESEIERLGQTNRELEFGDSEDRKRDQIGQAFGIPKAILTTDDVNRANGIEAAKNHARLGYWPLIQRVEDAINEQLLKQYGNIILIHDNPIPEDMEDKRAERKSRLESGYSVNEIRAMDGEEALADEGADMPLLLAGLIPLEQAVKEPAPMPAFGPPMLPNGNGNGSEEQEEEEPPIEERMFTFDQVKALIEMSRQPVRQLETLPTVPISQKAMFEKLTPGDIENPDGSTRSNKRFTNAIASTLRGLAGGIVSQLEGEPAAAISPKSPDKFLTDDAISVWSEKITTTARPHLQAALGRRGNEAMQEVGIEASFNLENTRTREYLERTERRVGREVTDNYRSVIRKELVAGIDAGESAKEIAKRIRVNVQDPVFTKAYAERIARTEMAFADINGTEQGWQQSGVVVGKQFVLAPAACPWCQAVAASFGDGRGSLEDSKTVDLGTPFYEHGSIIRADFEGTERTMVLDYSPDYTDPSVPPVHPHCRCSVRPVLEGE